VWVRGIVVFDGVEVEEASVGYALLLEDLLAGSLLGVVGEEPGGAEGNYAGGGGDFGRDHIGECGGELFGCDEVGWEGH